MIYTVNQFLKDRYGEKVYKLSLEGGFTCPNRDGTLGSRGCIFCSGYGSGDFAQKIGHSVTEQIEMAKGQVAEKFKGHHYIAYFQSFTNTYGDLEYMERLYTEAINHPDVVGLAIGTRPDCLGEEVLDLLSALNKIKPVWIELGLQTIHEKTADYIRRGYPLSVYDEAVAKLKGRGIEVVTHVILGLPGESVEEILETVSYVGRSGVQGIKLQLLHVIKGTDLEKDYKEGKFEVMTMEEYLDIIV
ncbi:MAG: TIGR01212 family radical SAM protein, partial [Lachnospiraceae bacterium]|nr:TIGR01212 family radical SAM protein [Candidatus Equihabitans merdae]